MADFYWAPSGHPFRVELRFTTSASPSQEGSALFATDFPRYTRSRWTKKDRDRLGDRFVDESSRCVVPGELLQPLRSGRLCRQIERQHRGQSDLSLPSISDRQPLTLNPAFTSATGSSGKIKAKWSLALIQ